MPTPAHAAAPKDPVQALKSKLISGHGVRFTETTTLSGDDKVKLQDRKGTFQFNAKGIAASDITTKAIQLLSPSGVISVGKAGYTSGGLCDDPPPAGQDMGSRPAACPAAAAASPEQAIILAWSRKP